MACANFSGLINNSRTRPKNGICFFHKTEILQNNLRINCIANFAEDEYEMLRMTGIKNESA